jgi:hypothetical protein
MKIFFSQLLILLLTVINPPNNNNIFCLSISDNEHFCNAENNQKCTATTDNNNNPIIQPSLNEKKFMGWLLSHGADLHNVRWPHYEDDDRMLSAVQPIKRGEKIFDIHVQSIISPKNLPEGQYFNPIFTNEEKLQDKSKITIEFIVFIMLEVIKKEESKFWPYLNILPKEMHRIQHWTDEELSVLQNESLMKLGIQLRENKLAAWLQFKDDCINQWNVNVTGFTQELFEWVSEMVGTRAHSFASESLKEFGYLALCPLVDMMNHRDRSMADLKREDDKFVVYAGTEDLIVGKGVYTMYGAYTDEHLLSHYGFVPDSNTFATYPIEIRFPGRSDSHVDQLRNEILKSKTFNVTGPVNLKLHFPPDDLIKFFRLVGATEQDIIEWGVEGFAALAQNPFRHSNEISAHMGCAQNIRLELKRFPTTLEEDIELYEHALYHEKPFRYRYVQALKYRVVRKKLLRKNLRYCDEMSFVPDGIQMNDLDARDVEEMKFDFREMRSDVLLRLYKIRKRDIMPTTMEEQETMTPKALT